MEYNVGIQNNISGKKELYGFGKISLYLTFIIILYRQLDRHLLVKVLFWQKSNEGRMASPECNLFHDIRDRESHGRSLV